MEKFSNHIIGNAIEKQKEKGAQNADQFTADVEKNVKENAAKLQEHFGESAKDVMGPVLKDVESYAQARKGLSDFTAEDLSAEQAAGLCDMSTKEVSLDLDQFDLGKTDAEEKKKGETIQKIAEHERRHTEQSGEFDLSQLTLQNGVTIKPIALYEGDAITAAGQNVNELTTEYAGYLRNYAAVVSMAGKETVEKAVKTGELGELQEALVA